MLRSTARTTFPPRRCIVTLSALGPVHANPSCLTLSYFCLQKRYFWRIVERKLKPQHTDSTEDTGFRPFHRSTPFHRLWNAVTYCIHCSYNDIFTIFHDSEKKVNTRVLQKRYFQSEYQISRRSRLTELASFVYSFMDATIPRGLIENNVVRFRERSLPQNKKLG